MYQTLVGIRVLCDWLDNPGKYEWVQFEADDLQEARGLDDIVAKRSDKLLDLIQVKFTVAPFEPANALSWDWLTARKGARGKSLLEKWSGAAFNVGLEHTAELRLITNRRPDADFTDHLRDGKVCLDAMPGDLREAIEAHVGGRQNAERFFERFEFAHSYVGYESLDRTISAAIEGRHTDHLGWLTLYRRAIYWSIHKDAPAPDGLITLEVLRSTISERQPRPLNQEFRVPAGYLPPDPEFADEFLRQAEEGAWDLRVLWGSPGQGKSTFLSYVCKRLEENGLPFIRHHYFLDLQDSSERFSLKNVARSLIAQMLANAGETLAHLNDQAENLRQWITTCSEAYAAQGKRFFVLIDGLDHVWRENDEEVAPLEALFVQLLPLPPNTTLILGSQRVDKAQLPARLNRYLEPEHWVELPRMHLRSVHAWLSAQHEAGIFQTEDGGKTREQLSQLSSAFERASEGHPLVLTYTFLALTRDRRVLTPSLLEDSIPTPMGDVKAYYMALWQRLSWNAKDALHLMAEDGIIWPAGTLEHCLGATNSNLEAEIGHLLSTVDAGLVAFHGSLYVFISSQSDHAERVQNLLPKVQFWLEMEAPPYLRWAWLWLYQSRCGKHEGLLVGTSKSWAIEALARAYPAWQIDRILKAAEEIAFSRGDYEQAIRKRSLKTRIHNGLSYQLDDAGILEDCALRLTEDPYPALLLASEVSQSNIASLYKLAMLYLSLDQKDRAAEVQERMRQRINDRIQSRALKAGEYDDLLECYLEVAAGTGRYEPMRVVRLLRSRDSAARVFAHFLNRAGGAADLAPCMAFAQVPMPVRLRRVLEVEAVRTAAWSGGKLHEWGEFRHFRKHPLSVCWRLLYQGSSEPFSLPFLPAHEALSMEYGNYDEGEFAQYLHFIFFAAVARVLQPHEAQTPSSLGVCTNRKWLSKALDRLAGVAHSCGIMLARGEWPTFSLVYQQIRLERPAVSDHESWSDLRALRQALVLITADVFFLARSRSHLEHVPASEWEKSKESGFFAEEHWREFFLTRHYRLLHQDAVALDIQKQESAIHAAIQPFNEKCSELSSLCSWATAYGLNDIADRLLASTYRCAIGYGWRKDYQLSRLLQAVDEVSEHSARAAMSAIEKLAPIYTNIDAMTEDSGANKSDFAELLLKLMPQNYIRYYRYWLDQCEWYEAERTFAAFAKQTDLQAPAALAAAAFLWDSQTQGAIRSSTHVLQDVLLTPWGRSAPLAESDEQARNASRLDPPTDESTMPSIESFPPEELPEFLVATRSVKQYQLENKWITRWFTYWVSQGRGSELLTALDLAHQRNLLEKHGTHLFDLIFSLSLNLQGPTKAFRWIIEAHRYRRGWSELYHGKTESTRRIALFAQHYPKRWIEFVAKSTVPIPDRYEPGLVIPDTALVSLLLQVGEIERAVSILQTLVDITQAEFEMQPLNRPCWLEGGMT
ncbi:NACHT domain-containing protein [Microvirgula aerodenitrificans]|uniref:NACHT domain-containing protein n=1 Tax=Microvirgula aerodenitrificans TaxID=57480 RepID=UPI00248E4335|nr:NACHT domain-containing protein [Microvirgula aerodenitrificans]